MATAAIATPPATPEEDAPRPELRVPASTLAALGLREGDVIVVRVEGDEVVLRAAAYNPDPMGIYAEWLRPDAINYAD